MTAVAPPTAERRALKSTSPLRAWLPTLVSITVAAVVFGFAFDREISGAVSVWLGSTAYNHCFLVLPLAAVLLWSRRDAIRQQQPRPSPYFLALLPPLVLLWLLVALLQVLEAQQILVVALFEVVLFALLGWRTSRTLLAPLLFLFFLVPFGAFLVPSLQSFTAAFTTIGLSLLHIPVFTDGLIIQIPEGSFEIAEACAGLRFLIASVVFGCFFATMMYRSHLRRMVFIALSFVVPIVANGFRALGIVVLAHIEGSATAVATDHVLYGWLFFTLVILLLIAGGMAFADSSEAITIKETGATARTTAFRSVIVSLIALPLIAAGPIYLTLIEGSSAAVPSTEPFVPSTRWVRLDESSGDWTPTVHGAQRESIWTYQSGNAAVTRLVALYALPARDTLFTKTANGIADPKRWRVVTTGKAIVPSTSTTYTVNSAVIISQGRPRLVWWFFAVDDQVTGSLFTAKLMQARSALLGGRHVGAFVALSTEDGDITHATEVLTQFMSSIVAETKLRPAQLR